MTSLADNIWWTRKSRIKAEVRLIDNARHSELLALWYAFFGTGVSVYQLQVNPEPNTASGILWVCFSILSLVMTGFINGLSFKGRAALIKECYETLNELYIKASTPNLSQAEIDQIGAQYRQILKLCENHTTPDYYAAICEEYWHSPDKSKLTKTPTKYIYFSFFANTVSRSTMIVALYLLPIIIFLSQNTIIK